MTLKYINRYTHSLSSHAFKYSIMMIVFVAQILSLIEIELISLLNFEQIIIYKLEK
jgi:hypothetical protein